MYKITDKDGNVLCKEDGKDPAWYSPSDRRNRNNEITKKFNNSRFASRFMDMNKRLFSGRSAQITRI